MEVNVKKSKISYITLVFFLFIFIYYPPIFNINPLLIPTIVSLIYLLFNLLKGTKIVYNTNLNIYILVIAIFTIINIIIAFFNKGNIAEATSSSLYYMFCIFPCCMFVLNYSKNNGFAKNDLLNMLIVVGLIQAGFSILAYVYKDFQIWFINELVEYGYSSTRFTQLSSFRWFGLASQLGFTTPIVQALISMIAFHFGIYKNKKYFYAFPLLCFSSFINSRTALVCVILSMLVYFLFMLLFNSDRSKILKYTLYLIAIFIIGMFLLMIMKYYAYDNYKWLVNGVLDFIGFNVETQGVYAIGNYFIDASSYPLPETISLFFGTGLSTRVSINSSYGTDIGFINDIWKYGVIGTVIIYYMLIYYLYKIISYNKIHKDGIVLFLSL